LCNLNRYFTIYDSYLATPSIHHEVLFLLKTHAVSCITEVYDSAEAEDFDYSDAYPIAWEIIYRNDTGGKELTAKVWEVMEDMEEGQGVIMQWQGKSDDSARSVELAFFSFETFRKAVHAILKNIRLHNDADGQLITKHNLIGQARCMGQPQQSTAPQLVPIF